MPSMVVIECPSAAPTGITQDRLGLPSKCTVQAPQSAAPQPNLVPFIPSRSRSSGISGGASTMWALPLIFRVAMIVPLSLSFRDVGAGADHLIDAAAAEMTFATSLGCDRNATWLDAISLVFAPIRFA